MYLRSISEDLNDRSVMDLVMAWWQQVLPDQMLTQIYNAIWVSELKE